MGGTTIADVGLIGPDDIIFNRIEITNIDFFDFSIQSTSPILAIRQNVAKWYYAMRILAIGILLVILIYCGVRMAITTIASDKAKYREMLINWAVSFALVFLLHYIIVIIIQLNNGLVNIMQGASANATSAGGAISEFGHQYKGIYSAIMVKMLDTRIFKSFAAIFIYYAMLGMTCAYLFSYIQRMLRIGFLILISPLITITYSIDKMGDGKSQALNTWVKEFAFNILIQPFHAIIFLVFTKATLDILAQGSSLGGLIFALMTFKFAKDGEKIIKHIFGFGNSKTLGETVASLAAINMATKAAQGAVKAGSYAAGSAGVKSATLKFGQNIVTKIPEKLGQATEKVGGKLGKGMEKAGQAIKNDLSKGYIAQKWREGAPERARKAEERAQRAEERRQRMQQFMDSHPNLKNAREKASDAVGKAGAKVGEAAGTWAGNVATAGIDLAKKTGAYLYDNVGSALAFGAVYSLASGMGANDGEAVSAGLGASGVVSAMDQKNKRQNEEIAAKEKETAAVMKEIADKLGIKDYDINPAKRNELKKELDEMREANADALNQMLQTVYNMMAQKNGWLNLPIDEQMAKQKEVYKKASKYELDDPELENDPDMKMFTKILIQKKGAEAFEDLGHNYKINGLDGKATEEFENDFLSGNIG